MNGQRTLVMLEPPLRRLVRQMAQANGVSLSSYCRDLIRDALEIVEDRYWASAAARREKGFDWSKGLSHEQVWRGRGNGKSKA